MALAGGAGPLLRGVAAESPLARRPLVGLAVLSLLAVVYLWLPGGADPVAGPGRPISLPGVLIAESMPARHFAKLALAVTWVNLVGSALGQLYWGWAFDVWGADSFFWIILAEGGAMVAVVVGCPGTLKTGIRCIHR